MHGSTEGSYINAVRNNIHNIKFVGLKHISVFDLGLGKKSLTWKASQLLTWDPMEKWVTVNENSRNEHFFRNAYQLLNETNLYCFYISNKLTHY